MSKKSINAWEKRFREEAISDDFRVFREHLIRLELPNEPRRMLEGTIKLVKMCASYCELDNQVNEFEDFLTIQTYQPLKTVEAKYAYTFDIHGMAYARVYVPSTISPVDLADLYGSPWHEYEVVGFGSLWISRPDWSPLSKDEVLEIEKAVSDDIYFDYSEEELNFWCDSSSDESFVLVSIQDKYDT